MNLIKKIKKKKELQDLPDSFVKEVLQNYLTKSKIKPPFSDKQEKVIMKEIRAQLRKYSGMFQKNISQKKRIEFLEKEDIESLLKTHSSTKERIESNSYPLIIREIKKLNPQSILDLGCGINPIAISKKLNPKILKYFASDIKENDLEIVKKFFAKNKIKGKVYTSNLTKEKEFPKTDLCILFKVLDIIETKGHKIAENILKKIPSKVILISFSTKTLSSKPMKNKRRFWLENMSKRLGYSYKSFYTSNEIFYIVRKN